MAWSGQVKRTNDGAERTLISPAAGKGESALYLCSDWQVARNVPKVASYIFPETTEISLQALPTSKLSAEGVTELMPSPLRTICKPLLASLIVLACLPADGSAQEVKREVLGIHLKLTKDHVHERLKEIGTFVRDERKNQEIWQVRDASFSHLIVAFGKDGKLRFVTAIAREDAEAKRVRYDEIGNLEKARQAGDPNIKNFNYEWDLASQNGNPRMLVIARGRDPTFLTTLSFKKMDGTPSQSK